MLRYSALAAVILLLVPAMALGDGFMMPVTPAGWTAVAPPPNFAVKYHRVSIDVEDQVLTCTIDQVFHNDASRDVEGIYLFPVPKGATITRFAMEVDGKPQTAEVLPKDKARGIYESIVRKRRDPGLLEYVDRDTFRASIFPIPAKGDKQVVVTYTQLLDVESGVCEIQYPLNTEKFSSKPLEEVTITARIKSREPIATVYSPSHEIAVHKLSNTEAEASYEERDVKPDTDFWLYYTVTDKEFGLHLLPHRPNAEPGYFLLLASPRRDVERRDDLPKDVMFVFDTSGSMAGKKIAQAKGALEFCVNSLRENDRFNVIAFDTAVNAFARELQPAGAARGDALKFVEGLGARGGTNISRALTEALEQFRPNGHVPLIVFVTDGMPTVGETDEARLLELVKGRNENTARLFSFGVGDDVNIHFLDRLVLQNGGDVDYVRPKEDIEVKVSRLFEKLTNPVLTGLELNYGDVGAHDVYPPDLPDLFRGSQLLVLGRYRQPGRPSVTLAGLVGDRRQVYEYATNFPERSEDSPFVPRLWAARKIGYLIDELRLHGKQEQELIDEIVRLSMQYGIMTEYTSFIVEEGGTMTAEAMRDYTARNFGAANAVTTGGYAVAQSWNRLGLQRQAQVPANVYYNAAGEREAVQGVRFVAGRAFYNRGGVWYDANFRQGQAVTQVQNFTEAQMQLSRAAPALNAAMALGERVVINVGNRAVEITGTGKVALTDAEVRELVKEL